MIFIYKKWYSFCEALHEIGFHSIPARNVSINNPKYVVLKHDVETDVSKAFKLACIEQKFGHKGTFYIQAYLLTNPRNIEILKKIQNMGHEISYHYDVMDSCKGNLDMAIAEFEENRLIFENNGFVLETLCQHGNPIVERKGYTSNRDFFRNKRVQRLYPTLCDIMVNFKEMHKTEYTYFSDAGRQFKMIYDPLNNDIVNSDDKNVFYKDLNEVLTAINTESGNIISTHPHRWTGSAVCHVVKSTIFKIAKYAAKVLIRIPFIKKLMNRYYYLAKKI